MGLNDSLLAAADYVLTLKAVQSVAGWLKVQIGDGTNTAEISTSGADGVSNTGNRLGASTWANGFNGATWDRLRAGVTAATAILTGWLNTLPGAMYSVTPPSRTDGQVGLLQTDADGALWVTLRKLIAGEDQTNNVLMTEQQFSSTYCTADTQVKNGQGFLHSVTFYSTDAVPTAGTINIYNNTAESGTLIGSFDIQATKFNPFTLIFDVKMTTGIYIGFTTTADVTVQVSYR